jgi:hypothetical protein
MCGTYLTSLVYVPSCVCTRNMNQVGASVGRCINSYSLISPLQFTYDFWWQICTTVWRHQCDWYLLHTLKEKCRPYRLSKVVASMAAAGKASACREMSAQGMSVHWGCTAGVFFIQDVCVHAHAPSACKGVSTGNVGPLWIYSRCVLYTGYVCVWRASMAMQYGIFLQEQFYMLLHGPYRSCMCYFSSWQCFVFVRNSDWGE